MMCVAVTYLIQPGHEEEAIELFATLTEQTHAEPLNLYYLVHRSPDILHAVSSSMSNTLTRLPLTHTVPLPILFSMRRMACSSSLKSVKPRSMSHCHKKKGTIWLNTSYLREIVGQTWTILKLTVMGFTSAI